MSIPSPFQKGAPDAPDYQGAANNQTVANRGCQSQPVAMVCGSRAPGEAPAFCASTLNSAFCAMIKKSATGGKPNI